MYKILFYFLFLVSCCTAKPPQINDLPDTQPVDTAQTYFKHNAVPVIGDISPQMALPFIGNIGAQIEKGYNPIYILINSPGGELPTAFALADFIKSIKVPTICYVQRKANSGAFYLLQACTVRIIEPDAQLAIHDPQMKLNQPLNVEDFGYLAADMKHITEQFRKEESRRLKIPLSEVEKELTANNGLWYLTAEEALKIGAVDKIETF